MDRQGIWKIAESDAFLSGLRGRKKPLNKPAMLPITSEFLEYLNYVPKKDGSIVNGYTNAILQYGDISDAYALLEQYLRASDDFYYNLFFPRIFITHGDQQLASHIFEACFVDGLLRDETVEAPLDILAEMQYLPVQPALIHYLFGTDDYYLNRSAALGLLHFGCSDIEEDLVKGIRATLGKNLFKEFMPALVCKVENNAQLLEELYLNGEETASADCNAGILLGFSLCGDKGKPWFMKALFSPAWESDSTATGTVEFAYRGIMNLEIDFSDLYEHVINIKDPAAQNYALGVYLSLVARYAEDDLNKYSQLYITLYQRLFAWQDGNNRNNIIDIAAAAGLEQRAEALESVFSLAITRRLCERAAQQKIDECYDRNKANGF